MVRCDKPIKIDAIPIGAVSVSDQQPESWHAIATQLYEAFLPFPHDVIYEHGIATCKACAAIRAYKRAQSQQTGEGG